MKIYQLAIQLKLASYLGTVRSIDCANVHTVYMFKETELDSVGICLLNKPQLVSQPGGAEDKE